MGAGGACLAGNGLRDKQLAAKRRYPEKIIPQNSHVPEGAARE
jgi:hypothetical protein